MEATRSFLRAQGLPGSEAHDLPTSEKRFPDGAQYRVEIPSVEGPGVLAAVFEAADEHGVTVHRVSQGSGGMLQTDAELAEMRDRAAARDVEVSLFARPSAGWDTGAMATSTAGQAVASQARGTEQLVYCLEDIRRTAAAGLRSVLVTDVGVLRIAAAMREAGELPGDMQFKVSVMMGCANPASIRLVEELGANTYNTPTDLSLAQLAAIRQAVDIPLDIYVEAPDNIGGFVRHYEIPEIVRVAAPVYVKFGLRNAPDIYPSGGHLGDLPAAMGRERVRRARIGLDLLDRYYPEAVGSKLPAPRLAVPIGVSEA
ncbi:MAG: U32 family peptidase [Streptosporangiaceae bacterium]